MTRHSELLLPRALWEFLFVEVQGESRVLSIQLVQMLGAGEGVVEAELVDLAQVGALAALFFKQFKDGR